MKAEKAAAHPASVRFYFLYIFFKFLEEIFNWPIAVGVGN